MYPSPASAFANNSNNYYKKSSVVKSHTPRIVLGSTSIIWQKGQVNHKLCSFQNFEVASNNMRDRDVASADLKLGNSIYLGKERNRIKEKNTHMR
jgi:hypothetical protein